MVAIVSLRELVDELQTLSDESHVYLNKLSGKVISITNDDFAMAENADESGIELDDDLNEYSELEIDFFQEVMKVAAVDNDYLKLPSKFEINEYEIIERFCLSFPNTKISNALLEKIRGSGAFRRFKDTIYRYEIEKNWFQYRDEAYKEIAISWLENHGFAYVDDMNKREQNI